MGAEGFLRDDEILLETEGATVARRLTIPQDPHHLTPIPVRQ